MKRFIAAVLVLCTFGMIGCQGMQLTEEEVARAERLGSKIKYTEAELADLYDEIKRAKDNGLMDSIPALLQKSIALQDDIRMYQRDLTDIYREAKERGESPWAIIGNLLMQFMVGLGAYAAGHKGRKMLINPTPTA